MHEASRNSTWSKDFISLALLLGKEVGRSITSKTEFESKSSEARSGPGLFLVMTGTVSYS